MNRIHTFRIRARSGIPLARITTRRTAQALGLSIADQARVAVATSSLAELLGLGTRCEGEIEIEALDRDGRMGLKVTCKTLDVTEAPAAVPAYSRQLVDELTMATLPNNQVCATLVQWRKETDHGT